MANLGRLARQQFKAITEHFEDLSLRVFGAGWNPFIAQAIFKFGIFNSCASQNTSSQPRFQPAAV
jgi:hypothetical protein